MNYYIWTKRDGSDAVDTERDMDEAIKMLDGNVERNWLIQEVARLTDEEVWKKTDEELLKIYTEYNSIFELCNEYPGIYDNLDCGFEDKLNEIRRVYDSGHDYWFERNWDRQTDSL